MINYNDAELVKATSFIQEDIRKYNNWKMPDVARMYQIVLDALEEVTAELEEYRLEESVNYLNRVLDKPLDIDAIENRWLGSMKTGIYINDDMYKALDEIRKLRAHVDVLQNDKVYLQNTLVKREGEIRQARADEEWAKNQMKLIQSGSQKCIDRNKENMAVQLLALCESFDPFHTIEAGHIMSTILAEFDPWKHKDLLKEAKKLQ